MKTFLKGILFGASIGGASGLLFAPKKGKVLQQEIDNYVVDVTTANKEFQKHLTEFKSSVKETSHLVATTIPELQEAVQKDLNAFKFQTDVRISRVSAQVNTLNAHLEEAKKNFKQ